MKLSEIKSQVNVQIINFNGPEVYIERLHEMGLASGMELSVMGRAPFKGPLLIRFKNTLLALRDEEAACTQVQILK